MRFKQRFQGEHGCSAVAADWTLFLIKVGLTARLTKISQGFLNIFATSQSKKYPVTFLVLQRREISRVIVGGNKLFCVYLNIGPCFWKVIPGSVVIRQTSCTKRSTNQAWPDRNLKEPYGAKTKGWSAPRARPLVEARKSDLAQSAVAQALFRWSTLAKRVAQCLKLHEGNYQTNRRKTVGNAFYSLNWEIYLSDVTQH